jgi:RNA polymerase sigma factor (sigma-70 family)
MPTAELEPLAPAKPVGSTAHDTRIAATDALLVRRMRVGDERSFEAIFKRHHAPLLSYCRHMLASRDEAEDALQQTFIRAHRALLGDSPPRELRPWLYAIARNCCLSAIAARRATDELDERTPSLGGLSEEVHEREELRELVSDIARLPEDQRSALLLSELDDLSHRAIATVVGCPVSKVKALVYQARTTLMAEREARGASCRDIREQLSVARGAELRRGPLRRHIRLCAGCRDFQLAVEAQRQSLAIVLPVLPSAALAARVLGHGALHAAGAAGVGQASAGIAPAAGGIAPAAGGIAPAAGGTVSATGTSVAAGGGTGIAAAGGATAGTTAAAGTTAVGGTTAGAWIGGGALAKVAVGGAVAALASVGAVAIPQRPWHSSRRVTHGTLHRGARSASSGVAAAASSGVVANAAFVSADGLAQTSGAAVPGSPAGAQQLDLSGLVSPAGGLEGAATGALTTPSSSSSSQLLGAGAIAAHARTSGTIAAAAKRRAQAQRARLRSLRHRRQLLKRERLLKRRLLLEQRRLRKQHKRRKQIPVAKPPTVAPPVATPTHKPARKPKTQTASSPTSSTAPTTAGGTTAGGTTTKHKTHPPEAPAAGGTSQTPESGGASGASPTPTSTTPASHKTGKGSGNGSATSGASGTSTGELGSPGASPTGSGETEGAKRQRRPGGAAGGGNTNGEASPEELLDASPASDQPLG